MVKKIKKKNRLFLEQNLIIKKLKKSNKNGKH
jgi:hypothetical protein